MISFANQTGQELFKSQGVVPRKGELIYTKDVVYRVQNIIYFHNEETETLSVRVFVRDRNEE